jgi:hypothetical protein
MVCNRNDMIDRSMMSKSWNVDVHFELLMASLKTKYMLIHFELVEYCNFSVNNHHYTLLLFLITFYRKYYMYS